MIITDSTDLSKLTGERGLIARDYNLDPYLGHDKARDVCNGAAAIKRLTQEERLDMIADKIRNKTTNLDKARDNGLTPYNQAYTNWCWANGTIWLIEFCRAARPVKRIPLSAGSVAAPATNYANINPRRGQPLGVGGYAMQALKYACDHGVAPQSVWGPNDPRPKDAKAAEEQRARFIVEEFDDLPRGDTEFMFDYVLQVGPVSVERVQLWSHLTVTADLFIHTDGTIGTIEVNSGYGRDANGFTKLTGRSVRPEAMVGVRTVAG